MSQPVNSGSCAKNDNV